MSKLYCKWFGKNMESWEDPKWEVGVPKGLPENNNSKNAFQYYTNPLLAVMFKKYHLGHLIKDDYHGLYEVFPGGTIVEDADILSATKMVVVKKLEIPRVSLVQKIAFGILCVKEVSNNKHFDDWANDWLSGKDRSKETADIAFAKAISSRMETEYSIMCYPSQQDSIARIAAIACESIVRCVQDSFLLGDDCESLASFAAHYAGRVAKSNNIFFDASSLAQKAMEIS